MDEPSSTRAMTEQDRQISEIVAEERSRLGNFIRRRVADPRDAEDILQDLFFFCIFATTSKTHTGYSHPTFRPFCVQGVRRKW